MSQTTDARTTYGRVSINIGMLTFGVLFRFSFVWGKENF